ncbi:hypothetical protein D910_09551 [Dendroctonus ponderosae]|uniref:Uncharacterized protein n=2 Tax=Dendroctonus ponderosae TaxID=77166 RepID=U4UIK4_DENPD|nr:hypothetical protein D910_09551 [Dendroctonus ponderosae]
MGHSIQQAEMNAAKKALELSQDLFPQLDHQKRVIVKSLKRQRKHKNSKNPHQQRDTKSPESYSRHRFKSKSPDPENGRHRTLHTKSRKDSK